MIRFSESQTPALSRKNGSGTNPVERSYRRHFRRLREVQDIYAWVWLNADGIPENRKRIFYCHPLDGVSVENREAPWWGDQTA
jgi:hypothetical protein